MSKETFKVFVRKHPELATAVTTGKATWQTLYETFDLYGEEASVWNQFQPVVTTTVSSKMNGFQEMINTFKNIDLDTFQKGINGLEKGVELLRSITTGEEGAVSSYEERPIHKYYED